MGKGHCRPPIPPSPFPPSPFPLLLSPFPFPRFPLPVSHFPSVLQAALPSSGLGAGIGPCMLLALVQAASFSALPLKRTR